MTPFLIVCSLIVALFLLRLMMFRGVIGEEAVEPPRGIIDMHCHTAGIGAGPGFRTRCAIAGSLGSI